MIYLDSSALLKLLVEEPESALLERWVSQHATTPMISSELARLEVVRAVRRLDSELIGPAQLLVAQVDLRPVTSAVLSGAAEVGRANLGSLDAIHLVSALSLGSDLVAVLAYDRRLVSAAKTLGLPVQQPGLT